MGINSHNEVLNHSINWILNQSFDTTNQMLMFEPVGINNSGQLERLLTANGKLQVDVISGGGGGTQYTEGDDGGGAAIGTVALGANGNGILRALPLDTTSGNLKVDAVKSGTWAVESSQSGTWEVTTYPKQWNGSTFDVLVGDPTKGTKVYLSDASGDQITNFTSSGKTLKSQKFSISSTGTVISAVTDKALRIYSVKLVCSAAISVNFRSGASTDLEELQPYLANGGYTESVTPPSYLFETTAGESLDLVVSGTGTASGRVSYYEE